MAQITGERSQDHWSSSWFSDAAAHFSCHELSCCDKKTSLTPVFSTLSHTTHGGGVYIFYAFYECEKTKAQISWSVALSNGVSHEETDSSLYVSHWYDAAKMSIKITLCHCMEFALSNVKANVLHVQCETKTPGKNSLYNDSVPSVRTQ